MPDAPNPIEIPELTPEAIRATAATIDPAFTGSPQYVHEGLTARLGVPVVVKVETVNPIRAFKGRGTWVAVHGLAGEGRIGRATARGRRLGRELRPGRRLCRTGAGDPGRRLHVAQRQSARRSPGCAALGATVIEEGDDFDDARGASEAYVAERTMPSSWSTATIRGSRQGRRVWRSS